MKKTININFENFWPGFEKDVKKNPSKVWLFGDLLNELYNVEINKSNPDYLVYSIFSGDEFKDSKYDHCTKIFYSAENMNRHYSRCEEADYTITHHKPDDSEFGSVLKEDTHLVMPHYLFAFGPRKIKDIAEPIDVDKTFEEKEKFCCLVTRNKSAVKRREVFEYINENYKRVDSAGEAYNNMNDGWQVPGWWDDDSIIEFASNYKFMIAIEGWNGQVAGYTTEKVYNALDAKTVPIYWGDPEISDLLNTDRLIYLNELNGMDEMLKRVKKLDQNEELYKEKLSKPLIKEDIDSHPIYSKEKIVKFMSRIFET